MKIRDKILWAGPLGRLYRLVYYPNQIPICPELVIPPYYYVPTRVLLGISLPKNKLNFLL